MKRDIARNRKVFHSSAANKDLCGHLVTSGNPYDRITPVMYTIAEEHNDATEDILNLLSEQNDTAWHSPHKKTSFDVVFDKPVCVESYRMFSSLHGTDTKPTEWRLSASNDGKAFVELDYQKHDGGEVRYGPYFQYTYFTPEPILPVNVQEAFTHFRFEILDTNGDAGVSLGEFDLISTDHKSLLRRADDRFEQCWKSGGNGEEYLMLDLGAESNIEEIVLEWGDQYAAEYELLASSDGETWSTVYTTLEGEGGIEHLPLTLRTRHIKLLMHHAVGECYVLRRWSVMGNNDLTVASTAWKLERATEVLTDGYEVSRADFDDTEWFPAIVPGTVLTSYMVADAVYDYNNDDNYTQHSDAFFTANWWYRHTFTVDSTKRGQRVWLNFDAVNWKADIFVNGEYLGDINGAFMRKKIDITSLVNFDGVNALAVLVHCNDFPGQHRLAKLDYHNINGGATGLDEPCLAATVGWDWISTVSGRGVGIYKDVYLTYSKEQQIVDPWFETESIDYATNDAKLVFRTEVANSSAERAVATLACLIDNVYEFSKDIELETFQKSEIEISDILLKNARLWYPVGYGKPSLYTAKITLSVNGTVSDEKTFRFGVRKIEYLTADGNLSLKVNGRRVCCVGGNWGMDDATSRSDAVDYDIKVRMHADMNFNIIRNWVGQTNDVAFYEACDKYGVMIWDDFWLANPCDGPEPMDVDMFMANAEDKVRKVRRHPSLVLYCARNEGDATEPLKSLLPALTARLDPHRLFIPHSAAGLVSGYGPYNSLEKEFYFQNTGKKLHSERGTPNIPELESVLKFLSPEKRWPINDTWVSHAFIVNGAQRCGEFCDRLSKIYGDFDSLEEFVKKSQMLCYETFKGIFEAERAADGGGMILWMSSPAMPSFAFQTYDYYYAQNGGYIGSKLANQPLYAYHNPITHKLVLSNRSGQTAENVTVCCQLFDLGGDLLWEKTATHAVLAVGQCDIADVVGDSVMLLRTFVTVGETVYRNFEWLYPQPNASAGLEKLAETAITVTFSDGALTVKNIGEAPAVMVSLTLLDAKTGERVLPVFWSDNYLALMPGEEQKVTYDVYGKAPATLTCQVRGYNVDTCVIEL